MAKQGVEAKGSSCVSENDRWSNVASRVFAWETSCGCGSGSASGCSWGCAAHPNERGCKMSRPAKEHNQIQQRCHQMSQEVSVQESALDCQRLSHNRTGAKSRSQKTKPVTLTISIWDLDTRLCNSLPTTCFNPFNDQKS